MAARLKVFVTSDGLTDFVVATTSKPKALAAWGSHQDLFKTGLAHEAAFERARATLQDKRAKLEQELADLEDRRKADLRRLADELSAARRALG